MFLTIAAIIIGGVFSGAVGNEFGAAIGAVIAWLVVRSLLQARRIAALEQAVAASRAPGMAVPDVARPVTADRGAGRRKCSTCAYRRIGSTDPQLKNFSTLSKVR